MIRDPSDPTNNGLFSKCARNHASKSKPQYHPPAHHQSSYPSTPLLSRKKYKGRAGFENQVSRDQRQKMYRTGEVPPVGQYNPIRKQHPKLVWDILKAYSKPKKSQHQRSPAPKDSKPEKPLEKLVQEQKQPEENGEGQLNGEQKVNQSQKHPQSPKKSIQLKPCLVDMSRQTGRRQKSSESKDWGSIDIMRSIGYIKNKITKNITLGSKKRQKHDKYKLYSTNTYDYDYRILKPQRKGLVDFSILRGRGQKVKTENSYSYQHYDYDNYVWQSNSNVFPNTKMNVVDFKKQERPDKNKSQWKERSQRYDL